MRSFSAALALALTPIASAGVVGKCLSDTKEDCLTRDGCRWFSYAGYCRLCDEWFGEAQRGVTGCQEWSPQQYCQSIFEIGKDRGSDPATPAFRDALQHYEITRRSGEHGDPHPRELTCFVWCDLSDPGTCLGQARTKNAVRGVNYGGRFIPEHFLGLLGSDDVLFSGVPKPEGQAVSLCDLAAPDAGERMASFLDTNIKPEHFVAMAELGFNVVRLPLGYWNLIDLPPGTMPKGPPEAVERWQNMLKIMPAGRYAKWIDKVFHYAKATGMRVLLDLHSAPGGQSGNENTGCNLGGDAVYHFHRGWNMRLAVEAVVAMARLCRERGAACYGIELLNEPFGPGGSTPPPRDLLRGGAHIREPPRWSPRRAGEAGRRLVEKGKLSLARGALAKFYMRAISGARQYLGIDTPIIIMDWPNWLCDFWVGYAKKFSYEEHGRIMFSTHLYQYPEHPAILQDAARQSFAPDVAKVHRFFEDTGFDVMVTEYSLTGHGYGDSTDNFDYNSFTNWFVHQFDHLASGSIIWNFDSFYSAWGPVSHPEVGLSTVDWERIWLQRSDPAAFHCAWCSPPTGLDSEAFCCMVAMDERDACGTCGVRATAEQGDYYGHSRGRCEGFHKTWCEGRPRGGDGGAGIVALPTKEDDAPSAAAAGAASPWAEGSCSDILEDCSKTKCCSSPGLQCYVKNAWWAACKAACVPGIDPAEQEELQTPWDCKELGTRTPRPAQAAPRPPPAPEVPRRPRPAEKSGGEEEPHVVIRVRFKSLPPSWQKGGGGVTFRAGVKQLHGEVLRVNVDSDKAEDFDTKLSTTPAPAGLPFPINVALVSIECIIAVCVSLTSAIVSVMLLRSYFMTGTDAASPAGTSGRDAGGHHQGVWGKADQKRFISPPVKTGAVVRDHQRQGNGSPRKGGGEPGSPRRASPRGAAAASPRQRERSQSQQPPPSPRQQWDFQTQPPAAFRTRSPSPAPSTPRPATWRRVPRLMSFP